MMPSSYQCLDICLVKAGPNTYRAYATDAAGQPTAEWIFRKRLDTLEMHKTLQQLEKHPDESELNALRVGFGQQLCRELFSGELGTHFSTLRSQAEATGQSLRLRLRVDLNSAPELDDLPWELLHDENGFLILDRHILLSRLPVGAPQVARPPLDTVLRMLVVIASPEDLPADMILSVDQEQDIILEALDPLSGSDSLHIDFVEDACPQTLAAFMQGSEYHILHYIGHGRFDKAQGKGVLLLTDEWGRQQWIENTEFARMLLQLGNDPRLIVLNACHTAKVAHHQGYAGLAQILITQGVPAVVAMQYRISDTSALTFARSFYGALASNHPPDLALAEARRALGQGSEKLKRDFAAPVLYLNDFQAMSTRSMSRPIESVLWLVNLGELAEVAQGFVGRQRELWQIQESLVWEGQQALVLYGLGGIGKSALVGRLASRLSDRLRGVRVIRMRETITSENILKEMKGLLNDADIRDFDAVFCSHAPLEGKTRCLAQILSREPFLFILDHCEEILDNDQQVRDQTLRRLLQMLLENVTAQSKFVFISRYDFDTTDGSPEARVAHLGLGDLPFPVAVRVMNRYPALAKLPLSYKRQVYRTLGGHPYSLRLLAHYAERGASVDEALAWARGEVKQIALLETIYSRLSSEAQRLIQCATVYAEAVPIPALACLMAQTEDARPDIHSEVEEVVGWGLLTQQLGEDGPTYTLPTVVRDFVLSRCASYSPASDPCLLERAAQYCEQRAQQTRNVWTILEAQRYYFQAHRYEEAADIVEEIAWALRRCGHLDLLESLLQQLIPHIKGKRQAVARGQLAAVYEDTGRLSEAVSICEDLTDIFKGAGDDGNLALVLDQLGRLRFRQGQLETAESCYLEAKRLKTGLSWEGGLIPTLIGLGEIYGAQSKYRNAAANFRQALALARKSRNLVGQADALLQLGLLSLKQGLYAQAGQRFQISRNIAQEAQYDAGVATALFHLGTVSRTRGNYREALQHYEESQRTARQIPDYALEVSADYELGKIHQRDGNYEQAKRSYRRAFRGFKAIGDVQGKESARYQLATIYHFQHRYRGARRHYRMYLSTMCQIGDRAGETQALIQLGETHLDERSYDEAEQYYHQGLQIAQEIENGELIAICQQQLGTVCLQQGRLNEAQSWLEAALKIRQDMGNPPGTAATLHQLGTVHLQQGQYDKARQCYQKSLAIEQEVNNLAGMAASRYNIALTYELEGEYCKAKVEMAEALTLFQAIESPNLQVAQDHLVRLEVQCTHQDQEG